MKKALLIFLNIIPCSIYAQAGRFNSGIIGNVAYLLFVIAIFVGIFLLLRSIVLWYWKVDEVIKNQQESNKLLETIAAKLEDINSTLKDHDEAGESR